MLGEKILKQKKAERSKEAGGWGEARKQAAGNQKRMEKKRK